VAQIFAYGTTNDALSRAQGSLGPPLGFPKSAGSAHNNEHVMRDKYGNNCLI